MAAVASCCPATLRPRATLPPAPPLPEVPFGLPPVPAGALDRVTPEAVAIGERCSHDPRLASDGKTTCATLPRSGASATPVSHATAARPRSTMPPQLANLAWNAHAIETAAGARRRRHASGSRDRSGAARGVPAIRRTSRASVARRQRRVEAGARRIRVHALRRRLAVGSSGARAGKPVAPRPKPPLPRATRSSPARVAARPATRRRCTPTARVHDIGFETPQHDAQPARRRGIARRYFLRRGGALDRSGARFLHGGSARATELRKLALTGQEQAQLLAFLDALSGDVPTTILQPLP